MKVIEVSDYTGVPEMFEGRVKTLVPEIQGGILFRRNSSQHRKEARKNRIRPIDLVVINLYQFRKAIKKGCTFEEAIEKIDIGGPTGIRAAAKNFTDVVVVVDPKDYPTIIWELQTHGDISQDTRLILAFKVFQMTARYDASIRNYFKKVLKAKAQAAQ